MNKTSIIEILNNVKSGEISPNEALSLLKIMPYDNLDYAKIDYHRGIRQGANEVIFGLNKTPEQILGIANAMSEKGLNNILITRMSQEAADIVGEKLNLNYNHISKTGIVNKTEKELTGSVVIASAGTSDMAVCEEAAITAEVLGSRVTRLYDVGVAGLHRLLDNLDIITNARVIVAVAGMEGALASVIGGLTDAPVIAVPTSVGYGASFGGVSALLSMLNSCASGVSVVNIDNGFGAGYLANTINQMEGLK